MADTLRTRIAAAIMQTCHGVYLDDAVLAADAVIRELGLREEFGALDDQDGGLLADTREELSPLYPKETIKRRFITDWETDG